MATPGTESREKSVADRFDSDFARIFGEPVSARCCGNYYQCPDFSRCPDRRIVEPVSAGTQQSSGAGSPVAGASPSASPADLHRPFYSEGAGPAATDWRCSYDGAYMSGASERCRRCNRTKAEAV